MSRRCTKRRFRSDHGARKRARVLRDETGLQFRAYQCPQCRGWHVTTDDIARHVPNRRGPPPAPVPEARTLEDLEEAARRRLAAVRGGDDA